MDNSKLKQYYEEGVMICEFLHPNWKEELETMKIENWIEVLHLHVFYKNKGANMSDFYRTFNYHKNWNDLMRVVEKIHSIVTDVNVGGHIIFKMHDVLGKMHAVNICYDNLNVRFEYTNSFGPHVVATAEGLKMMLYEGIVEFITFYNEKILKKDIPGS